MEIFLFFVVIICCYKTVTFILALIKIFKKCRNRNRSAGEERYLSSDEEEDIAHAEQRMIELENLRRREEEIEEVQNLPIARRGQNLSEILR